MIIIAPFASKSTRTLPYPAWTPFSLESDVVFCLQYLHEGISLLLIVKVNVALETLAIAVLLQLCGHLEIVMYRLNLLSKIPENINEVKYNQELEILKQCLKKHLHLLAIGDNVNKQFGISIFMQFFASTISLCTIIFSLSNMNLNSHHSWLMIFCANSYTIQIFIYCYFGQQITEKSTEIGTAAYFLNWNSLTIRTKKSLIILMMRTVQPIKLSAASIIVMSLETFMKILKASYSTYNLLKNSS
ncbi:odorant receptor 67c-like isoform X1 [Leptopilina heterotoma]|uniref:odorant receptor 67c-like isoform X1 n=1 Tax=Leptopilina heterotoma TaxID=63436 RepID=UPI001CA86628|nr:odorant receptor 67c-like isoform X1 [Leptopilina heterotoma]